MFSTSISIGVYLTLTIFTYISPGRSRNPRLRANPIMTIDATMGDGTSVNAAPDGSDSIRRDSDVWFEDGNIVVIAQNTTFRFHKGVLSLHSQAFRDLFSVPQPHQNFPKCLHQEKPPQTISENCWLLADSYSL